MIKVIQPPWIESKQRRGYKHKPKKLCTEMIFRKSFMKSLREYIDNCSLAGVKQMCDPGIGIYQRFVWITVFLIAIGVTSYFFFYIWSDTLSKPLIVTMETLTYPISKVNFPAIALCNINRISKKAISEFAHEIYPSIVKKKKKIFEKDYPIELVEFFIQQWGRLIDFTYNESIQNHPIVKAMVELYREDTTQITEIMKRLAPSCDDMLLKCAWGGKLVDCRKIFKLRRTFHGHCCTFNFLLDHYLNGTPFLMAEGMKRQNEPGYYYGLNILLDPLLEDYAYPLKPVAGFDVFIFPPTAYPDSRSGRVLQRLLQPNKHSYMEIKSVLQLATAEVRKYSHKTRKCYFRDEDKDKYNNMYSYSACLQNCRVNTLYSLCKCVPYYLAKFKPMSIVCSIEDLRCLNKYKEKLLYLYPFDASNIQGLEMEMQESLWCEKCLPKCEVFHYYTKAYQVPLSTVGFRHKDFHHIFIDGLNMTNKTCLSIYFPVSDSTLDRLDVVHYWFEILSNIGGFCSMIIGLSLVSVIELIFYFFIRFPSLFYENYRKYH